MVAEIEDEGGEYVRRVRGRAREKGREGNSEPKART